MSFTDKVKNKADELTGKAKQAVGAPPTTRAWWPRVEAQETSRRPAGRRARQGRRQGRQGRLQ
jgi:hypothetical protein